MSHNLQDFSVVCKFAYHVVKVYCFYLSEFLVRLNQSLALLHGSELFKKRSLACQMATEPI